MARLLALLWVLIALPARADGPPLPDEGDQPAPPAVPQLDDRDGPTVTVLEQPAPPPFLPPRRPLPPLPPPPPPHRGLGVGLIVLGNVLQFAGVSMIIPGYVHKTDSSWSGRAPLLLGLGGAFDGLGNVIEAVGWGLAFGGRRVEQPR